MSKVNKLLGISYYATLPVISATAERNFSAMHELNEGNISDPEKNADALSQKNWVDAMDDGPHQGRF